MPIVKVYNLKSITGEKIKDSSGKDRVFTLDEAVKYAVKNPTKVSANPCIEIKE